MRKTPTAWLAIGVGWLTIQVLLQRRGLLTHDTRLDLLLDPREFLGRLFGVWDARADMGRVQNQAIGYLFPMGPALLVGRLLAIPPWIVERLWMALLLGLAFWGTARIADELNIGVPT